MAKSNAGKFNIQAFVGLDKSVDPAFLKSGYSPDCLNCDTHDGNLAPLKNDVHIDTIDGLGGFYMQYFGMGIRDIGVFSAFRIPADTETEPETYDIAIVVGEAVMASVTPSMYAKVLWSYLGDGETTPYYSPELVFDGLGGIATYMLDNETYAFWVTGKRNRKGATSPDPESAGWSVWYVSTSEIEDQPIQFANHINMPDMHESDWNEYSVLALHRDRVWVSGNPMAPYAIVYSQAADPRVMHPEEFTGSLDDPARPGMIDVGAFNVGPVVGLYALFDELLVLCERGALRITGYDPTDFAVTVVPSTNNFEFYGGRLGLALYGNTAFITSKSGLCVYDGVTISEFANTDTFGMIPAELFMYDNNLYMATNVQLGQTPQSGIYDIKRQAFMPTTYLMPRAVFNGQLYGLIGEDPDIPLAGWVPYDPEKEWEYYLVDGALYPGYAIHWTEISSSSSPAPISGDLVRFTQDNTLKTFRVVFADQDNDGLYLIFSTDTDFVVTETAITNLEVNTDFNKGVFTLLAGTGRRPCHWETPPVDPPNKDVTKRTEMFYGYGSGMGTDAEDPECLKVTVTGERLRGVTKTKARNFKLPSTSPMHFKKRIGVNGRTFNMRFENLPLDGGGHSHFKLSGGNQITLEFEED